MKISIKFSEDGLTPRQLDDITNKYVLPQTTIVNGFKGPIGYRHGFIKGKVRYEIGTETLDKIINLLKEEGKIIE